MTLSTASKSPAQRAVAVGGPHHGAEFEVPEATVFSFSTPTPGALVYNRTKEKDEFGRVIYEWQGR